jgi:hypothetical protein
MSLKNNTAQLQDLLAKVNALPDAGGVDLPELSNEGGASDLLSGKELIDSEGNVVTGGMPNNGAMNKTMDGINTKSVTIPSGYTSGGSVSLDNTIDNEVTEQADLIAQIKNVVDSLPEAGGEPTEINLQTKTVTPTTSPQAITADAEYDGLEKVTVNAIPSTYVEPAATKSATTYTPGASDQTISAGTYCSGVQTIKGDANLIPANIVSGKSIFGVEGNAENEGGQGEFETATVSVTSYRSDHWICYTGVNEVLTQSNFGSLTFTCIKPSVVYLYSAGAKINTSTNIECLLGTNTNLFIIRGDGTIALTQSSPGADD